MAQKRYITCDRCGKTIIDFARCSNQSMKEYSAKIHYWGCGTSRSYSEQRIDLCVKCDDDFIKFISGEKNGN